MDCDELAFVIADWLGHGRTYRTMSRVLPVAIVAFVTVAAAQTPPPTRPADAPDAPHWTVITGAGRNAPVDRNGDFLIGPEYLPAPETTPAAAVPQGRIIQFTMESKDSRLYPGIARDAFGTPDPEEPRRLNVLTHPQPWTRAVSVYVPAQLAARGPAPFIVIHDGPRAGDTDRLITTTLDNLIAQRRIPAMVAVSIQNGGGDAQGSERGLEYDTVSGRFAEFVETEVLPLVEKNAGVMLTNDPDARAVMGCSSGAAAAFTMAWFHPEWYRRIISYSGTFVNQQWPWNPQNPGGAWDYHVGIIAGAQRKPLRIWMHVGDRDLYNPNTMRDDMHDWVAANHRMARVLKEKRYDYQYVFALDSSHCDRRVREQTLPQALEWVWRGYRR
jgi:enterochelin esterase family protein